LGSVRSLPEEGTERRPPERKEEEARLGEGDRAREVALGWVGRGAE
jgi:hypothetical protein